MQTRRMLLIAGVVALQRQHARPRWEVVDRYCVGCHNENDLAGGLAFDDLLSYAVTVPIVGEVVSL